MLRLAGNPRLVDWLIASLVLAVFVLDLLGPWCAATWLAYLGPLALSAYGHRRLPLALAGVCSALLFVKFLTSAEVPLPWSAVNRTMGAVAFWAVAVTIAARLQSEDQVNRSSAQLRLAVAASGIAPWDRDLRTNEMVCSPECRILQAQEQERRRIAMELHDSTAQDMAAVMLILSSVRERLAGPACEATTPIDDALAILERIAEDIRTLS